MSAGWQDPPASAHAVPTAFPVPATPRTRAGRDRRASAAAHHRQRPGPGRRHRHRPGRRAAGAGRAGGDDRRGQRRRPRLHGERAAAAPRVRAQRHPGRGRAPPVRWSARSCGPRRSTASAGSGRPSSAESPVGGRARDGGRAHGPHPARPPGARRDRPDRAADEHRPAAAAAPGPGAADRPPLDHGRVDRGGEHDGLGRVQHLRRPRGRGRRLPVRRADLDDGPRHHPPGGAGPRLGGRPAGRWRHVGPHRRRADRVRPGAQHGLERGDDHRDARRGRDRPPRDPRPHRRRARTT